MKKIILFLFLCSSLHLVLAQPEAQNAPIDALNSYIGLEAERAREILFAQVRTHFIAQAGAAALVQPESQFVAVWHASFWSALKSHVATNTLSAYRDIFYFAQRIAQFATDTTQGETLELAPSVTSYRPITLSRATLLTQGLENNTVLFDYLNQSLGSLGMSSLIAWSPGCIGQCKEYLMLITKLPDEILSLEHTIAQTYRILAWLTWLPTPLFLELVLPWVFAICDTMSARLLTCTNAPLLSNALNAFDPLVRFCMRLTAQESKNPTYITSALQLLEAIEGPLLSHARESNIAISEELIMQLKEGRLILQKSLEAIS